MQNATKYRGKESQSSPRSCQSLPKEHEQQEKSQPLHNQTNEQRGHALVNLTQSQNMENKANEIEGKQETKRKLIYHQHQSQRRIDKDEFKGGDYRQNRNLSEDLFRRQTNFDHNQAQLRKKDDFQRQFKQKQSELLMKHCKMNKECEALVKKKTNLELNQQYSEQKRKDYWHGQLELKKQQCYTLQNDWQRQSEIKKREYERLKKNSEFLIKQEAHFELLKRQSQIKLRQSQKLKEDYWQRQAQQLLKKCELLLKQKTHLNEMQRQCQIKRQQSQKQLSVKLEQYQHQRQLWKLTFQQSEARWKQSQKQLSAKLEQYQHQRQHWKLKFYESSISQQQLQQKFLTMKQQSQQCLTQLDSIKPLLKESKQKNGQLLKINQQLIRQKQSNEKTIQSQQAKYNNLIQKNSILQINMTSLFQKLTLDMQILRLKLKQMQNDIKVARGSNCA